MRRFSCQLCGALVICVGLLANGCGGNNATSNNTTSSNFLGSGLYQINGTSSSSAGSNFTVAGSLTSSGNNISGMMHITMLSCFSFATDIPVSGTLGDTIQLVLSLPIGQKLFFTLTHPGGHTSFLSGTYSLLGSGCAVPDQGSADGRGMNFSGNWTGTFTSSSAVTSMVAMTLTQTRPDAHGFFSATGSATITGGTCFPAGNVDTSTVIIGQGSKLTLDNSAPASTGITVLSGDFTEGGFFALGFNGTYTSTQGACSETGTVSMSAL